MSRGLGDVYKRQPFILACLLCIGGERLYLRLAGSLGARLGRRRS
nr:hypothetical protein [Pseudomonas aeruginosa]